MDYKNTLNLPRTDFPMKADLVQREPQRLAKWEQENLYGKIQEARKDAPKFVLHDGPPFANGDVHIGTALNKILKDIIIRYKTLRGFNAPYVPGWDCHGLPIEFKVSQEMRKAGNTSAEAADIRKACDAYARKFIDLQRTQFKRLGVLGDWENPYLTLDKEYEADELRLFADIVEKGFVYRGKKPVYWSIPCRTALAEAEVEYHDHVSQSVYVKFPVVGSEKTFIIIWTTTPWTLPANLAVAYNSNFEYTKIQKGGEIYIVSMNRMHGFAQDCGWKTEEYNFDLTKEGFPAHISVSEIKHLKCKHPFINRIVPLLAGDDFVEETSGTGFVHIAPGHGLEDYNLGRKNGLLIYSPVDDEGKLALTNDLPAEQQMPAEMVGKSILEKHGKSEANEAVLHELRIRNAVLHQNNYHHSYPFCWRSKTPVIFRAMDQWFIKVDHDPNVEWLDKHLSKIITPEVDEVDFDEFKLGGLRLAALRTIRKAVNWIPDWGKNRIEGAVKSRPDWCISRQRTWGVPIPAFYDAQGNAILDAEIIRNTAKLVKQHGSNIWFEKSANELWSLVKPVNWTGSEPTAKSNDTLDVWIDSGSSSKSVLQQRKELQRPEFDEKDPRRWQADVYLEGSDQHRGWFQSSLLLSLAGNGAAPFKTVLTHGFMVDADKEKISKSKQAGYDKPQTADAYVNKYGADVVRLWVASQDYRNDIVVSEERINKVGETYRGIRNALRYQLSNLYDFDPAQHTVADDKLTGLDRWILAKFSDLEKEVIAAYDAYEFHVVYQKISQFVAVELSSIYHDVVKDRLYTDAANSHRRRSTQTALYRLATGLCKMLAPILVFTADESWGFVPGKTASSIHQSSWQTLFFNRPDAEETKWQWYFKWRDKALYELEQARQHKTVGKALEAKSILEIPKDLFEKVQADAQELQELLNLSKLNLEKDNEDRKPEDVFFEEIRVLVSHADGEKCERCWHWETDVGSSPEHPTICARCVEAIMQFKFRDHDGELR